MDGWKGKFYRKTPCLEGKNLWFVDVCRLSLKPIHWCIDYRLVYHVFSILQAIQTAKCHFLEKNMKKWWWSIKGEPLLRILKNASHNLQIPCYSCHPIIILFQRASQTVLGVGSWASNSFWNNDLEHYGVIPFHNLEIHQNPIQFHHPIILLALNNVPQNIRFLIDVPEDRGVAEKNLQKIDFSWFSLEILVDSLLGGSSHVHRGCGWVHPSYLRGRLAPTKIPWKKPGSTNPQPRFVGWTTKYLII